MTTKHSRFMAAPGVSCDANATGCVTDSNNLSASIFPLSNPPKNNEEDGNDILLNTRKQYYIDNYARISPIYVPVCVICHVTSHIPVGDAFEKITHNGTLLSYLYFQWTN